MLLCEQINEPRNVVGSTLRDHKKIPKIPNTKNNKLQKSNKYNPGWKSHLIKYLAKQEKIWRERKDGHSYIPKIENKDNYFIKAWISRQQKRNFKQFNKYEKVFIDVRSKIFPENWNANTCKFSHIDKLRKTMNYSKNESNNQQQKKKKKERREKIDRNRVSKNSGVLAVTFIN